MPSKKLKPGKSKAVVASNIGKIMHSYKKLKKIGNTKGQAPGVADKQAVAIAFKQAGKYKEKA